jgi:hypothetical protein
MMIMEGLRLVVMLYDNYIGIEMTGGKDKKDWKGALIEVYVFCTVWALAWVGSKHRDSSVLMAYMVSGSFCFMFFLIVTLSVFEEFASGPPALATSAPRAPSRERPFHVRRARLTFLRAASLSHAPGGPAAGGEPLVGEERSACLVRIAMGREVISPRTALLFLDIP